MLPEEQTPPFDDDDDLWPLEDEAPPAPDAAPPEGAQDNEFIEEDYADWSEDRRHEQEWKARRAMRLLKRQTILLKRQPRQAEETSGEVGDTPHAFECGSEEELKQITVAIVQSDSELFADSKEAVQVTYRAKTPTKRAYMMKTQRGQSTPYGWYAYREPFVSGRLQALCDLAQRLNTFTGVTYEPLYTPEGHLRQSKKVHKIEVVVTPPSRHEQAESLLMLNDWLEDKVSERRKAKLLGLTHE